MPIAGLKKDAAMSSMHTYMYLIELYLTELELAELELAELELAKKLQLVELELLASGPQLATES